MAYEGETDPGLADLAEEVAWAETGRLWDMFRFFKAHDVGQAVMAGGMTKTDIFGRLRPDERFLSVMERVEDMHDDHLLRALAEEFEKEGIVIKPSTLFTPQLFAPEGVLTVRGPSPEEMTDVEFGWRAAKSLGSLDIGQCVVVRGLTVLALEAIEGTNEAIRRGGRLGREKAVVVKVSKPDQDMRFDVPSVGPETVAVMAEVKASVLVLEADRTLLFDREEMIAAADRAGIAIVVRRG